VRRDAGRAGIASVGNDLIETQRGQQGQEEKGTGAAGAPALAGAQSQNAGISAVGEVRLAGGSLGRASGSAAALGVEKGGGVPAAQA
jgi:hypothetical protein